MRNYLQLPQFQPGDSRINVAPLHNALEAYGNKTMQFNQIERQNEQQQYQRGREAKQDARQETFDQMRIAEQLAQRADAIGRLPPEQRGPAWQQHLAAHERYFPGNQLDPEDLDPMQGPARYAAAFGGIARDPREDKLIDLKIAEAQKSLAAPVGGTPQPTALIQNYNFRNSLKTPEERAQFDDLVRRQNMLAGDTLIDGRSGAPVANVGDAIARGEQQKVFGREMGERQAGAPKAAAALESANVKSDVLIDTIARARRLVGPMTTGLPGAALSNIPGTSARDLSALTDTLKANAGFQELQTMRDNSPTGGALGQVAVQELAMLQATITSLEQAHTAAQFSQALDNFEKFVVGSKERRKAAYDATYGGAQQPQQMQVAPQPTARQVPTQAAQMLRGDPSPEAIREFNEVFGPGAAEGVLNGR